MHKITRSRSKIIYKMFWMEFKEKDGICDVIMHKYSHNKFFTTIALVHYTYYTTNPIKWDIPCKDENINGVKTPKP